MIDSPRPDSGCSSDILQCYAKTALLYEELRAAIDGGHESMTHADALAEISAIRAENETLHAGYAAARLEIASLQARIKTMAEEHADELMVAHMDGIMRAAQPAGAQQPAPSAAAAVSDEDEALDLLATLFDAWENGTPCYEEPESSDGFLGHAFRLDDEVFHRCADLLNRRRGKQPSPTPQADSQPAPVRDYPPLPDFDTVEQHIYGACRRYITQDMLEPIHNLIRETVDADRAARATAGCVTAPAATPQPSPAPQGATTDEVDVPHQCPYFGPSPHRDVWLAGWYAARAAHGGKPCA